MKKGFTTILLTMILSAIVAVGVYRYVPLDWIDALPSIEKEKPYGATITTILGTDTISGSRSTINTNFANLNTDKIEVATTSVGNIIALPGLTTAGNLVTIGTIATGRWNGIPILSAYGGTGTTTFPAYHVLIASSTGAGIMSVSGLGASGQFLTSNGAGAAPSWTTSSVDLGITYAWTNYHTFNTALLRTASSSDLTVASSTVGTITATTTATISRLVVQNRCTGCVATSTFVSPESFTMNGYDASFSPLNASSTRTSADRFHTFDYVDGLTSLATANVIVPPDVTGISSMLLFYKRQISGDVVLSFTFGHIKTQTGSLPFTVQTDISDSLTAYTSGAADGTMSTFTVPTAAYDALTNVTPGDIIGVEIRRAGADAGDTYTSPFRTYGVKINWN